MMAYLGVNLCVLLAGILLKGWDEKSINSKSFAVAVWRYFLLLMVFLLLFLFSAMRGSFTSDYDNYNKLYDYYMQFKYDDLFRGKFGQELGYVGLNIFIGSLFGNFKFVVAAVSFVTVLLFLFQYRRESCNVGLCLYLFVVIGTYYASFNIMRQAIAVAIVFSGSSFLYNRKPFQYLLVILVAAMFHKTALLMVVVYFFIGFRPSPARSVLFGIASVLAFVFLWEILAIIQPKTYVVYTRGEYGMVGTSWKNIIAPIGIGIFTFYFRNRNMQHGGRETIWYNGTMYYLVLSLLGLRIMMVQRLAEYFVPFAILNIANTLNRINPKYVRLAFYAVIVVLSYWYSYFSLAGTGYEPYYFADMIPIK